MYDTRNVQHITVLSGQECTTRGTYNILQFYPDKNLRHDERTTFYSSIPTIICDTMNDTMNAQHFTVLASRESTTRGTYNILQFHPDKNLRHEECTTFYSSISTRIYDTGERTTFYSSISTSRMIITTIITVMTLFMEMKVNSQQENLKTYSTINVQ